MTPAKFFLGSALLVSGWLPVVPAGARGPDAPYGQSNVFVLDTNRIGFGHSGVLLITNAPDDGGIPAVTVLGRPVPNPFNPRLTVSFDVAAPGRYELNVYDLGGRHVRTLAAREFAAGRHSRQWDGRDDAGAAMPAGVYVVRISGAATTDSQKVTLVR